MSGRPPSPEPSSAASTVPPRLAASWLPSPNISKATFFRTPFRCSAKTRMLPIVRLLDDLCFFAQQPDHLFGCVGRLAGDDAARRTIRRRQDVDHFQQGAGCADAAGIQAQVGHTPGVERLGARLADALERRVTGL